MSNNLQGGQVPPTGLPLMEMCSYCHREFKFPARLNHTPADCLTRQSLLNSTLAWCKVHPDQFAVAPTRFHPGDAGYDLSASEGVVVPGRAMARIPTNIRVSLPTGYWAMLVGRSSTFFKRHLLVQTAIIDNGFRGELWCVVRNMENEPVAIARGERVLQMILLPLTGFPVQEVQPEELPEGDRQESGFGSTGI